MAAWGKWCLAGVKRFGPAIAGATAAVVAAPLAISAAGFGAGGIAKGSVASGAMSTAATWGVGKSAVSDLQSAGAAGLALTTKVALGATGAGIGQVVKKVFRRG